VCLHLTGAGRGPDQQAVHPGLVRAAAARHAPPGTAAAAGRRSRVRRGPVVAAQDDLEAELKRSSSYSILKGKSSRRFEHVLRWV
jgi:hypothetical protein